MKKFNAHLITGTADGVTIGDPVSGNTLFLGKSVKKVRDLSALLVVDAETNTWTMTPRWQVSNDESTWYVLPLGPENPSITPIATGTGGADVAVNHVLEAPRGIEGWQFCRAQVVIGVATGTANDTFQIGYNYTELTGAEIGL